MKNLKYSLVAVTVFVFGFFFQNTALAQDSARISFDKKIHDYGTIYQNDNGFCEFTFTNTGKIPLVLTNVYSSCGCTVPSWPKEPTMPGKSNVIKVKYNTSRLGAINKSVTVESNAANGTQRLQIKGNVLMRPAETLPEKEDNPMKATPKDVDNSTKARPTPY